MINLKALICENCGAPGLILKDGYLFCEYCRSKFLISDSERAKLNAHIKVKSNSSISLENDIETLLLKCKNDSENARRYANLILDIDPDNVEALKYL